jgi:hypothetical protein
MSEQESNESKKVKNSGHQNDPVVYVYIPDEGVNGFLISQGAYSSTVQYFIEGVGYIVDMPNDEFIVVDEIGVGYIDETDDNL